MCDQVHPGHNGTAWHVGRGVADLRTGKATLFFDNLVKLNGSFNTNFTAANWSDGTKWQRLHSSGQTTSISLDACRGGSGAKISNHDGHLSCDWKQAPPPRVGNKTGAGLLDPRLTCRFFHHYTFLAPQFKYHPRAVFVS